MVALTKDQQLEMSPSFSVKNAVEQHTKETVTMTLQFLEMEVPEMAASRSVMDIHEYLDMPFSATAASTTATLKKTTRKSVQFSDDVKVREIPTLTQQEKEDMFFNKQDKRNSKLQVKRLVTFWRNGRHNNYFFGGASSSPSSDQTSSNTEIFQIPQEEQTKIGLEAHMNPQMKIAIRRRMTKMVMQHQDWSRQHPTFFDGDFLAQNCTTVAKSSTLLAQERAQTVLRELQAEQRAPRPFLRGSMTKPGAVTILCAPESSSPAIETVMDTSRNNNMKAPGQACMVR